eukprot:m.188388 g.188388  ORF g.188388 m.188388 type:complete len:237 (+) comp39378_c2_seq25:484-1194(+)
MFQLVHSRKPVRYSHHNPSHFDQPEESVAWLKHFRAVNSHLLSDIKTLGRYSWGKKDVTTEGEPLGRIIDQGLRKPVHATDAVGVVLKEVVSLANNSRVMLAVDDFNGFFGTSSVNDSDGNKIRLDCLSLVNHFLNVFKSMKRGSAVLALSRNGLLYEKRPQSNPAALLGELGLAAVTPCVNVRVSEYSEDEIVSVLSYYKERQWLAKEFSQKLLAEVTCLTQRNPVSVRKLCYPC